MLSVRNGFQLTRVRQFIIIVQLPLRMLRGTCYECSDSGIHVLNNIMDFQYKQRDLKQKFRHYAVRLWHIYSMKAYHCVSTCMFASPCSL
jgi:hypothetical protein